MGAVTSRRRLFGIAVVAIGGLSGCLDSVTDNSGDAANTESDEGTVPDRFEPVLESYRNGTDAYETAREELWETGMEELAEEAFEAAEETVETGEKTTEAAEGAFEEAIQQVDDDSDPDVANAVSQALESTESLFNSFVLMESAAIFAQEDEEKMVDDFISGTKDNVARADETSPLSVEEFEALFDE